MLPPAFKDILAAREFIARYLPKTPLARVEKISLLLDCDYYAKLENLQPVGAFKVRGGVNLVGTASEAEKRAGMVSASTGNHGQSIAYAGRLFGVPVIIYAPAQNVNQDKIQAIRDLGAEVRLHGRDFDEAREEAEAAARGEGCRYVHSGKEAKVVAGAASLAAVIKLRERLQGKKVVGILSGGNIPLDRFTATLSQRV